MQDKKKIVNNQVWLQASKHPIEGKVRENSSDGAGMFKYCGFKLSINISGVTREDFIIKQK